MSLRRSGLVSPLPSPSRELAPATAVCCRPIVGRPNYPEELRSALCHFPGLTLSNWDARVNDGG